MGILRDCFLDLCDFFGILFSSSLSFKNGLSKLHLSVDRLPSAVPVAGLAKVSLKKEIQLFDRVSENVDRIDESLAVEQFDSWQAIRSNQNLDIFVVRGITVNEISDLYDRVKSKQ